MACCAGRKFGSSGPEINTTMQELKVEKFDEIFKTGAGILQIAEDLRSGLQDSKACVMALTGCCGLKTGGMADAIQVWLWSVCQECGADAFANIKPKIDIANEPHFNMELDPNMSDENKEIYEALKLWVETVCGAAAKVEELTTKLQDISKQASELAGTAKDDFQKAGLGAMDIVKAVKNLGLNTKTLAQGTIKLTSLGPLAAEALTDLKDIAEKMTGILADAVKNSNEGKEKGAKNAATYCKEQHPGEKIDFKQAEKDPMYVLYKKNAAAGKKLGGKKEEEKKDEEKKEEGDAPAADAPADAEAALDAVAAAVEEAAEEAAVDPADVTAEVKEC